jgi:FtsP/CotA-like multicopper oxidase with cupredoxin domain
MMMAVTVIPAHGEGALPRPAAATDLALDVVQLPRPAAQKQPFDDFAYVLHQGDAVDRGSGTLGPLIVLHANQPTAITVSNHLREDTTVHWHGMPVQNSYDDGGMAMDMMPGMAAMPSMSTAPVIGPGKSFVARFTPEYAGTFMYHTHMDDTWQLVGGLAGPLVVLPRGATFDPATDHIVMVTSPPDHAFGDRVSVNGYLENPPPIVMHAGVPQRLRLINMTVVNADLSFSLDGGPNLRWTPLAIDGIDLDRSLRQPERAIQRVTIGQTRDFTFVPMTPGRLLLQAFDGGPVGQVAVDVVP